MENINLFIEAAKKYYEKTNQPNSRYISWEHCYKCFSDARNETNPDIDSLCLHLAFYLASWGMYRASSFLLSKDYKVHIGAVTEILKKDYDLLLGIECEKIINEDIMSRLEKLYSNISDYYSLIRGNVKKGDVKSNVSSVLVTKILLGTLGCVPAYDRFFINGIRKHKVAPGTYSVNSLSKLADYYKKHSDKFEYLRNGFVIEEGNRVYPQMKLLDMGFWQIGADEG